MIDERLIDIVIERLIQRVQDTNTYILQDIGKSIKQLRDITKQNGFPFDVKFPEKPKK